MGNRVNCSMKYADGSLFAIEIARIDLVQMICMSDLFTGAFFISNIHSKQLYLMIC